MERGLHEEYKTKINITVTDWGRDEAEALKSVEDLLRRTQYVEEYDILDIAKMPNHDNG